MLFNVVDGFDFTDLSDRLPQSGLLGDVDSLLSYSSLIYNLLLNFLSSWTSPSRTGPMTVVRAGSVISQDFPPWRIRLSSSPASGFHCELNDGRHELVSCGNLTVFKISSSFLK